MQTGEKSKSKTQFKAILLPTGEHALIPTDLTILIPAPLTIPIEDRHYLAYIPWDNKYLNHIPKQYRDFFEYILPSLHTRTSDVHTALSVAQLPSLLRSTKAQINERIVYLALILHDCGWSQVDEQGLVMSLSYGGLSPTSPDSMKPKQQHLIYGAALAHRLLDAFDFGDAPLTATDIYEISEIIRRHDHDAAWEQGKYGQIGEDIKIVCDSDRLWSYTYENFWLDIIRKGVSPDTYLETIEAEISSYFLTDQGKTRARQLTRERKVEVQSYLAALRDTDAHAEILQNAYRPSLQLLEKARRLAVHLKSRRLERQLLNRKAL